MARAIGWGVVCATVAILGLAGCKRREEPPPPDHPDEVSECTIEEAKLEGGKLALGKIHINHKDIVNTAHDLRFEGKLVVEVAHEKADDDPVLAKHTRVCGGDATLTAASWSALAVGRTSVVLAPAPCPSPAADEVVGIRARVVQGAKEVSCSMIVDVPRELGGAGLDTSHQRARRGWAVALKDKPDLAGPIVAYGQSLPRVALAVGDPTVPRKTTSCPVSVKGAAPLVAYATLREVAERQGGKPPTAPIADEPSSGAVKMEDSFVHDLDSALNWVPEKLDELSAQVKALSPWIVVITTRSFELPKTMPGDQYTSGNYWGDVVVVDRTTGKIACASPFSASNHGTVSSPQETFVTAITAMARAEIRRIAPGLTEAK